MGSTCGACKSTAFWAPPPELGILKVRGEAPKFAFLTSSQVTLQLLVCEPHSEQQ